MKTAEITRHKQAATGIKPPSTWAVFADIYRREGLAGINKGVNAVAVRQCTNWGSRYGSYRVIHVSLKLNVIARMGFARLAESSIRSIRGKGENDKLGALDKILASSIGGALATWNQPIEVVRVEVRNSNSNDYYIHLFEYVDAIYVEKHVKEQASKADDFQYFGFHLQGKWDQGLVPRCHSSYWSGNLANCLHGVLR